MGIHPLALTHGLTPEQLERTVEDAAATIAIDNGPTLILILGFDADNQLVEMSGVIRPEDVLFVHAAPARPEYQPLLDTALALPGSGQNGPPPSQDSEYGWSVDGFELTESLIADLIEAAKRGYDIDTLRIRLRPGRPAPLSVGEVMRLELEPSVHAEFARRADAEGVAVHEVIRRAIRARLHPTPGE